MKFYIKIVLLFLCLKSFILIEEDLKIETKSMGAELTSIKYKGKEYLHDGKTFWNQHSPILFPIVGKLRYDKTKINGKEYAIPKHGFAMNMNFEEIGEHSYLLKSNNQTLSQLPYEFELYVSYLKDKNKLFFNYTVINKTPSQTMLFGIGGHPGFKCEYYKEKSSVEFEEEENNIKVIPVDINVGLMSNITKDGNTVLKNKKILEIKKDSFKDDAIVFTDIKSKSVILNDDGKRILKFNFEKFKYLGIWSAEGEAPYVCFEPWYNTPDYVNSTIEFIEKKDIIKLEPNGKFEVGFSVEFYDDSPNNLAKLSSVSILLLVNLILVLL